MTTLAMNQKDGYKVDHRSQYPDKTEGVYSNMTPRSVRYMPTTPRNDDKIVVYGISYVEQSLLIELWNNTFFNVDKTEAVLKYKRRIDNYLGPDKVTYEHIEALHDLGFLPVRIKSLPEGSVTKALIPHYTIENTMDDFEWVTNMLETQMSCQGWKMPTSATTSRKYRDLFDYWCKRTGGDMDFVPFQAHDFSFRGLSGIEDAAMSGSAHLLSFVGTDTIPAIDLLEDYYGADCEKELIGCSIPATEHSCMCLGSKEGELETYRRLITEVYPTGMVAAVSDTWDFFNVCTNFMVELKDAVLGRDGKLILRPDSGDPADIICGTRQDTMDGGEYTNEEKGAIQCLWEIFDGTETKKGFKVLDEHIGLIYGEKISLEVANDIFYRLEAKGFASTNAVFGVGSFSFQYVTRDSLGWAIKATAGKIDGQEVHIFKDPITDDGTKKSATGYLRVEMEDGDYVLYDRQTKEEAEGGELKESFLNGELIITPTLAEIRARMDANALYR